MAKEGSRRMLKNLQVAAKYDDGDKFGLTSVSILQQLMWVASAQSNIGRPPPDQGTRSRHQHHDGCTLTAAI
jgi:hypothetical protein